MNTNDPQFLKAYNDLVAAFINFMNVVNPQGAHQPNLSYVASQLSQLLKYIGTSPQVEPTASTQPLDEINEEFSIQGSPSPIPTSSTDAPVIQQPTFNAANAKTKYCAYPELVKGRYKFKSSMITEDVKEVSVYRLTIDEEAETGFVELQELSDNLLRIVISNPSLYTPLEICPQARNINPEKTSVSSQSKLRLVKVVRGWEIAEGEKFELTIS